MKLLRYYSLSFLGRERGRLLFTWLGIVIGVALCTAIQFANRASLASFQQTEVLFSEPYPIEVHSKSGAVPHALYQQLYSLPDMGQILPHSEQVVEVQLSGTRTRIRLYGVDMLKATLPFPAKNKINMRAFLAEPAPALISQALADKLSQPERITVRIQERPVELSVQGVVSDPAHSSDFFIITDTGHFQNLTGSAGFVDYFRIKATQPESTDTLIRAIAAVLPPSLIVQNSGTRAHTMERATEAFRLNIQFLGAISIIVAALLVYTFISYIVLKRRAQFAVLRTLGVTPRQLSTTVLLEAGILGIAGAIPGYLAGYFLATVLVADVAETIHTLYVPTAALTVTASLTNCIAIVAMTTIACVLSAVFPAREVLMTPPVHAMAYQQYEQQQERWHGALFLGGLVLTLLAVAISRPQYLGFSPIAGFVPPVLFIAGVLAILPAITRIIMQSLRTFAERNAVIPLALASGHILATLRRSTVSIAALSITFGTAIGIIVLIHSFRGTVTNWIESVTPADLYISAGIQARSSSPSLPEEVISFVDSLSGIQAIDSVSVIESIYRELPVEVRANRFDLLAEKKKLPLMEGSIPDTFPADEKIAFVSEAFARKHATSAGDSIRLDGTGGSKEFLVGGVFQDYTTEHGVILISRPNFVGLFPEQSPTGISLYLDAGIAAADIANEIAYHFPNSALNIRDKRALRAYVQEVFDQTFKVTYVLQTITLCIAVFVLINTTLMLMLERAQDIAILRTMGISGTSIRRMLLLETVLIGAVATGMGAYTGGGLSLFLVYVVNVFFFGWLVSFSPPWMAISLMLLSGLLLALVTGFICSFWHQKAALHAGGSLE